MLPSLKDEVLQAIETAQALYHRLVVLVGPAGSGKTPLLKEVSKLVGAPLINVNQALSQQMLNLTQRQRALRAEKLLEQIVKEAAANAGQDLVLLDNTELLFDVQLRLDPLRLLQQLSRNRTIVASWNGNVSEGYLIYAEPGHLEYRREPVGDTLIISLSAAS